MASRSRPETPSPARAATSPTGPLAALSGIGLAVVLLATAAAYAPALPAPFVLDDWGSIENNMRLRSPDAVAVPSLPELLGPNRALTELTFALDWRAVRIEPFRYHLVGLLLHLAAVVAAFAWTASLLRRSGLPRALPLALVVAGAFALHPIQAESVAYAAQRSEVLASLLVLVSLLLLDRAVAAWPGWRGGLAWVGGGFAWVLGMGAKTIAITAPAVLVLEQAVVAPPDEHGRRALGRRAGRALLVAAPLLALAAWSATLHVRTFVSAPFGGVGFGGGAGGFTAGVELLGVRDYFLTQLRVQWLYLRLLAWPDRLAFDRTFAPSHGLDGAVLLAAAGLLALLALAGWLWVRAERSSDPRPAERVAALGILWWFVVLAPTSSIVPVVDLAVEHRVYLACLGPFLALVVGADALLGRLASSRRAAWAGLALSALVLGALGFALAARASTFRSEEALWAASAEASPDNARAWTNLGLARARRGDRAGAVAAYEHGWTVVREPARAAALARNHSAVLLDLGRTAQALEVLRRGLALSPADASLHANRAAALASAGRPAEALPEARMAVEIEPGNPLLQNVLAQALYVNGDVEGSLAAFRAAAALDPGNPAYAAGVGAAAMTLQRREEACAAFRTARSLAGARPLPLDGDARARALGCPTAP